MTSRWILYLIPFALMASPPGVALNGQRERANAAQLETGSVEERLKALVDLLTISPPQREPAIFEAVKREATRMLAYYRRHEQVSDDERELNSAYAAGLVRALGESKDPTIIPTLIAYAGFVSYASDALVTFGDVAVPAMILTVQGSEDDLSQREGVTVALGDILGASGSSTIHLSDVNRQRMIVLADELLKEKFTPNNIVGITVLALATGRPDFREQLEELAKSRESWNRRGVVDSFMIQLGQSIIQAELRKSPKP
jgi:hypothetical protein